MMELVKEHNDVNDRQNCMNGWPDVPEICDNHMVSIKFNCKKKQDWLE